MRRPTEVIRTASQSTDRSGSSVARGEPDDTDALIMRLAGEVTAVAPRTLERRLSTGLASGVTATLVLLLLAFGIRPDLLEVARQGLFWIKIAFTAGLGLAGLLLAAQLARPDCRELRLTWLPLAGIAGMGVLALADFQLRWSGPETRLLLYGWQCVPAMVVLAVPAFVALAVTLRTLAPTRLRLAGAAVGLCSGGAAALVYSLACHEISPTFVVTRYSLAVLALTALGAAVGPRILRWR